MNHVLEFIQNNFPFLLEHKYLFLFIATSLEGFNTVLVAGFLVSIGALNLVPTALISLAGEVLNSTIWYAIGYWGGAKPIEWFIRKSPKKRRFMEQVQHYVHEHTGKFMMIIKLTYSITTPALLLIGSTKYNFKKFTLYNIIGSIGWIIITISIGYFFGQGYKLYAEYLKDLSYLIIFAVVSIIVVILVERFSGSLVAGSMEFHTRMEKLNKQLKKGVEELFEEPRE
jgi:membrane-associated protein